MVAQQRTDRRMIPCGNRILIRVLRHDELTQRLGSLWLPQSAEKAQRYRQWEIVAVGPDVLDEVLLPGARILIAQYAGSPTEIDGEACLFVFEENIDAVFD